MEREILFRGKQIDNDNGAWVKGCLINDDFIMPEFGARKIEKEVSPRPDILTAWVRKVDPETVCQYTGLTDKNGKKIFEGDIIKYHFGEDVAPVKFGSYQSCFDSQPTEHCGFYVDWNGKRNLRKDLGYWVHMVDAEIVGNIHDNPELLKGDAK